MLYLLLLAAFIHLTQGDEIVFSEELCLQGVFNATPILGSTELQTVISEDAVNFAGFDCSTILNGQLPVVAEANAQILSIAPLDPNFFNSSFALAFRAEVLNDADIELIRFQLPNAINTNQELVIEASLGEIRITQRNGISVSAQSSGRSSIVGDLILLYLFNDQSQEQFFCIFSATEQDCRVLDTVLDITLISSFAVSIQQSIQFNQDKLSLSQLVFFKNVETIVNLDGPDILETTRDIAILIPNTFVQELVIQNSESKLVQNVYLAFTIIFAFFFFLSTFVLTWSCYQKQVIEKEFRKLENQFSITSAN